MWKKVKILMIQTMVVVLFYNDSRERNNITYFFQQCVRINIFEMVAKLVLTVNSVLEAAL